jgi:hypothetical protein
VLSLTQANDPCIAGCRAKEAKTSMASLVTQSNNQELRRFTDAGAVPDWFPGIHEVWTHAVSHVNHNDLAPQESPHRFALPPIHLFWGGEPQNQLLYFYHYLLLFNEIRNRPESDLPALTTQDWRSILGNTYWKKQWPKPEKNKPSMFDPNKFWKYGGPLLFGDERSAKIAAGRYDPTSRLPCQCVVELATAEDTDLRQAVVYNLNSYHLYEEIREMERVQFPVTFEKRWKNNQNLVNAIVELWDPSSGGAPNSAFFCNKKAWRNWVRSLRDLVADWDGFERWDWAHFSDVRNMGINRLQGPEFRRFTVRLLAFFIHSFVQRLGYYPSSLLCPSIIAGHTCALHHKKFGYSFHNLPIAVEH